MKNELMIFNNDAFGEIRMVDIDGKPYAVANDVVKALGYKNTSDAISKHCRSIVKYDIPHPQNINKSLEVNIIPQGDVIRLITKCPLPNADRFESWIFDEVIPQVLNTGSYIQNNKLAEQQAIAKVMENADEDMLQFVQGMVTKQIELTKENKELKLEIIHKENVIIGFVEDIDLATKRQRLNQIMKFGFKDGKSQSNRWNLLYDEFQRKYHCNLKLRMEGEVVKPKYKNKLDYIDRGMNMIPQIYELACKIFENDVDKLKEEWFDVVNG